MLIRPRQLGRQAWLLPNNQARMDHSPSQDCRIRADSADAAQYSRLQKNVSLALLLATSRQAIAPIPCPPQASGIGATLCPLIKALLDTPRIGGGE